MKNENKNKNENKSKNKSKGIFLNGVPIDPSVDMDIVIKNDHCDFHYIHRAIKEKYKGSKSSPRSGRVRTINITDYLKGLESTIIDREMEK